jgi:hypothetical protein
VHLGSPNQGATDARLLELAMAGELDGLTIINRIDLAEKLVPYVRWLVLRFVSSDHDSPTQDFQEINCDKRIILQWGNEANVPHDADHWLRQMKAADLVGRKIVIFNDSVGWTSDETWRERKPAMEYALLHGHYIGMHCYGNTTGGAGHWHPMVAYDNPGDWRWFAGRVQHLYEEVLPQAQPMLIMTECGGGGNQLDAGVDNWLRDIREMKARAALMPYLKSWHYWTTGGKGGYQFDRDCLDDWLNRL